MTQRKLIQAFRAFVQKSVLPYNQSNQVLLNDWKHFNNILSSDPIDSNQLDFYLYIVSKQQNNQNITQSNNSPPYNLKSPPERQSTSNITDFNISKFGKKPNTTQYPINNIQKKQSTTSMPQQPQSQLQSQQNNNNNLTTSSLTKRKTLLANIQNFQSLLIRNQQKLQTYNRNSYNQSNTTTGKQSSFNTSVTSNGTNKKYY